MTLAAIPAETTADPIADLAEPGPIGRTLLDHQARTESNARTYPRRLPVAVAEASGSYLTDVDGRRYIDFLTGAGVLALGHNHPDLIEAVRRQLTKLTHGLDLPTPVRDEFRRRQLGMLPESMRGSMKMHFCGPTGADGVEAAVKLCKKATGRGTVVAFQGSYHGSTHGAMSLTSETSPKTGLHNLLPGIHFAPYGYCHRCPLSLRPETCATNCAEFLANTLTDTHGGVQKPAALILELVQGEGGSIPAPEKFVHRVAGLARTLDIPLIVDEVQTGCGRTGTWFAFEQYGIEPDVVVASKGLSGMGLPVSVIMYHERLDVWSPGSHIGTFRGNNLAFASANAYLDVLERDNLLAHVLQTGDYLFAALRQLQRETVLVADVRGRGLMLGMEMAGTAVASATEVATRFQREALRRGLIVEIGGREDCVVRLLPALNVSRETTDEALAIMRDATRAVEKEVLS
ncbi:diaminobutyrate--2-oxoglutarate transaminase family protein [Paractinoplanes rishiriensis]|uniref:Diaminobutyrate--2-oxoglutarate transaminase n=1 Tax=Paractinoplanes rishiriensis TaxID=1050105 RepID=A0A919N1S3_9ACTN|nr:diaminobutyrate--2-oxoglutarate transaminase family protein [Actinoplanes rishiriensis]GIE97672.1 diaminobutyrate--2-oxoglutarate aminotransferase [Actinoplanes rishiriensis]